MIPTILRLVSILLIGGGITAAAFGMGLDSNLLLFLGIILVSAGFVVLVVIAGISFFWQYQRRPPGEDL